MAAYAFAGWFLWLALWPVAGWSQNVYRCDSSYSPVQCDGGTTVNARDVGDVRTKEQKRESDQSNRKIRAQANAMEKARLKEEAARQAQHQRDIKAAAKARAKTEAQKNKALKQESKAGSAKEKAKKPKVFVAKGKPVKN